MSKTTLIGIVLGIVMTLTAGSIVCDVATDCAERVSSYSAPLYDALD